MKTNYIAEAEPKAWADGIPVYCAHDKIEDVAKLVPNPRNPNTHPDSQIQLLGRIIRNTGWRQPITVSTRSGFIVKGHGRLQAALLEGVKEVPVDLQSYTSEAEEYADLIADNRLAELSEIDNRMLADIFADIDTGEIPLEMTGYTEDELTDAKEQEQQLKDKLKDAKNGITREAKPRFSLGALLGGKKQAPVAPPVKTPSMSDFKGAFYTGSLKCPSCGKTGFFSCNGCHNLVCHDGSNKAYCPVCEVGINISGTIKNMSGNEKDVPDGGNNTSKYTMR